MSDLKSNITNTLGPQSVTLVNSSNVPPPISSLLLSYNWPGWGFNNALTFLILSSWVFFFRFARRFFRADISWSDSAPPRSATQSSVRSLNHFAEWKIRIFANKIYYVYIYLVQRHWNWVSLMDLVGVSYRVGLQNHLAVHKIFRGFGALVWDEIDQQGDEPLFWSILVLVVLAMLQHQEFHSFYKSLLIEPLPLMPEF